MGMDVYGRDPKNETGEYFRRNVWGWRPLWDYCLDVHPEIAGKVKYGHSNDGDGLASTGATSLGKKLKLDIKNGLAAEYIETRDKAISLLPKETCNYCKGEGKVIRQTDMEKLEMIVSNNDHDASILEPKICHVCSGEGFVENWAKHYFLRVQDIEEFAEFLINSGGFKIY